MSCGVPSQLEAQSTSQAGRRREPPGTSTLTARAGAITRVVSSWGLSSPNTLSLSSPSSSPGTRCDLGFMPLTTLRVELPAYSHSFHVPVNPATTVVDVKQEIAKVCPGSPDPSGQRLVWRGRFLRDEETLEDVFKVCVQHFSRLNIVSLVLSLPTLLKSST